MKFIEKISILLCCVCLTLAGCSRSSGVTIYTQQTDGRISYTYDSSVSSCEASFFSMDTYMTITAYGERAAEAVKAAAERILEIEEELSVGINGSEVYEINNSEKGILGEDGKYLLEKSLELNALTGGALNPVMYPVMDAWGFTTSDYRVPYDDELDELKKLTDISNITFNSVTGEVNLSLKGCALDFGAIAKGFASSEAVSVLDSFGIESAKINLGGNVQLKGTKPDGSLWRIGIADPYTDSAYLAKLSVFDKAVITSGGYERYFTDEETGETYHHIMNPETASPAYSGIISATIISSDGTAADALSTSLYIMGLDSSVEFFRNSGIEFDFIILTESNELYVTENLAGDVTSDLYKINIVKR